MCGNNQLEGLASARMTMDEYIRAAARTDSNQELIYYAIGMAEEGGEVLSLLKKHVYHGHPLDRDKLILELGDVAWSFFRMCAHLGVSPEEVFRKNNEKLLRRYPNGFSSQQSIERKE